MGLDQRNRASAVRLAECVADRVPVVHREPGIQLDGAMERPLGLFTPVDDEGPRWGVLVVFAQDVPGLGIVGTLPEQLA